MNVSQSCSPSRFDIKEEVASSLCRLDQNMCQSHIIMSSHHFLSSRISGVFHCVQPRS